MQLKNTSVQITSYSDPKDAQVTSHRVSQTLPAPPGEELLVPDAQFDPPLLWCLQHDGPRKEFFP